MRSRHSAGLLLAVAGLVLLLLVGSGGPTTTARFTDAATGTTGAVGSLTVVGPSRLTCGTGTNSATVSWTADVHLDYQVVLRRTTAPAATISTRLVTGTASSVPYTNLSDFGFPLNIGLGTYDFEVDVRAYAPAPSGASTTPWLTPAAITSRVQVSTLLVGLTATCRP
ncbi:hypothetical protein RDV89_05535 [Nocardioides zeae]|uniref:Uncharacterized protein n=1 Tax=Nocardioides imazamoxiresistens TaxID=3231893 RepID=A0ABU3PTK0_9ACTN|nr:hypothetical protein [Nocardioides zeae]MDT9592519.1 hypothetical protein [Nocardioides zeae]